MINGDHAHPGTECHTCGDRGWIDDRSTAVWFVRRCPDCADRRVPVSAAR